jgi:hypothetical protein
MDEAERFLGALDPTAIQFTFQTFDDDKARREARTAEAAKRKKKIPDPFAKILHGDRFGGDKAVHDLPRVMRLPGFAHQKDIAAPPFVTRMIEEREGARLAEFPVPKPNGGGATTEGHTQYASGNGQVQDSKVESKVESKLGWLNTAALQPQNQSLWVPHLFPGAESNRHGHLPGLRQGAGADGLWGDSAADLPPSAPRRASHG